LVAIKRKPNYQLLVARQLRKRKLDQITETEEPVEQVDESGEPEPKKLRTDE
jgi:hypothetical protein